MYSEDPNYKQASTKMVKKMKVLLPDASLSTNQIPTVNEKQTTNK